MHVQHAANYGSGQVGKACQGERYTTSPSVTYTRHQLLAIPPAPFTSDLLVPLRELGIGFRLPRKRTYRTGRRKQRRIKTVISVRPPDKKTKHANSLVNFDNLTNTSMTITTVMTKKKRKKKMKEEEEEEEEVEEKEEEEKKEEEDEEE
ncbi:hypothetical protein ACOMHN_040111 [Nucella lapillus]